MTILPVLCLAMETSELSKVKLSSLTSLGKVIFSHYKFDILKLFGSW